MRGRQQWTGTSYINRTNYPFHFNRDREPPEVEARYTLYMYEALDAIKQACAQPTSARAGRGHLPRQRRAVDRGDFGRQRRKETVTGDLGMQSIWIDPGSVASRCARHEAFWQKQLPDGPLLWITVPFASSLLKKGTGSERNDAESAERRGVRGACPLFQQAAKPGTPPSEPETDDALWTDVEYVLAKAEHDLGRTGGNSLPGFG